VRFLAGVVATFAICTALAACGGSKPTTRDRLATYFAAVNRIERQLGTPLNTVDSVDQQLTGSSTTKHATKPGAVPVYKEPVPEQEQALQQAAAQINKVGARLRALAAPAPAADLKSLMVELVSHQQALLTQTQRLVAFAPGFQQALAPLTPAVTTLKRVLAVDQASGSSAVQQVYSQKATALRGFASTLTRVLGTLGTLQPPSSSEPSYNAERRSLTRMRTAAGTLANELSGGHTSSVQKTLAAFDAAAAVPSSRAVQLSERAAVKAYDRQVDELNTLVEDANRERARLADKYP
jgi:hypothetical protein